MRGGGKSHYNCARQFIYPIGMCAGFGVYCHVRAWDLDGLNSVTIQSKPIPAHMQT